MRAGNSSDNGVGSCINFFRIKADAEFAVFVEDLTVYHGKLYVLFAAAVNEVFDQIIFRLHVRLVQINHDEIRLFANGETVTVIDLHRVCAACGCHVEYRISRDSCGVHLTDFGKTGGQEHQQEREQAFLSQNRDCFAIYQVSRDDPQNVRFMNLDWLKSHDISIDRSNYDLIYTAPLSESGTVPEQLEKLYRQFNLEKPVDYHSPSMSVSDIVAIKQNGKVSCHYCDSVGFTQIPGFLPENPLKNAEMAVEDDYGMIDGIINNGAKEPTVAELEQQARSGQPISLMDLADAVHREERDKKKSVVDQLKSQPKAEHKKTAPKKSAEREI